MTRTEGLIAKVKARFHALDFRLECMKVMPFPDETEMEKIRINSKLYHEAVRALSGDKNINASDTAIGFREMSRERLLDEAYLSKMLEEMLFDTEQRKIVYRKRNEAREDAAFLEAVADELKGVGNE